MGENAGWRFDRASEGNSLPEPALFAPEEPCPPALAERMRLLHSQLIHIFGRVVRNYRRGAYGRCVLHLRQFDQQLRSYLCSEGAELEMYLGVRLAGEPDRLLTLRQVRARLRSLVTQANGMLAPPRAGRLNPAWGPGFVTTFENMGMNLDDCIDIVELDFLTLCPPSFDHEAWAAVAREARPMRVDATDSEGASRAA
jgi:hypothetical protein